MYYKISATARIISTRLMAFVFEYWRGIMPTQDGSVPMKISALVGSNLPQAKRGQDRHISYASLHCRERPYLDICSAPVPLRSKQSLSTMIKPELKPCQQRLGIISL